MNYIIEINTLIFMIALLTLGCKRTRLKGKRFCYSVLCYSPDDNGSAPADLKQIKQADIISSLYNWRWTMFHPKHVLSSLKNIGKMNFKSIEWFIKAINIYICFFCLFFFVLGFFCWFVFFCLVFVFVVGTKSFFFQFVVGFG